MSPFELITRQKGRSSGGFITDRGPDDRMIGAAPVGAGVCLRHASGAPTESNDALFNLILAIPVRPAPLSATFERYNSGIKNNPIDKKDEITV